MSCDVLVLAGGVSPEREISLRSGRACFAALQKEGLSVAFLDITGCDTVKQLLDLAPKRVLLFTHGEGGEDGRLQGLLDWLELPYSGSSAPVSSLCMDKYSTQLVLREAGLPLAKFCCPSEVESLGELKASLGVEALFCKPRWGGSSLEAGLLNSSEQWNEKRQRSRSWMVEEAMTGRELTVGLLQTAESWRVFPILELRSHNAFYDFESKYTKGMTDFLLPAPLEPDQEAELRALALRAAEAVGLEGYGRVDFMLSSDGPKVIEVNTLPGMTDTSDLPAMAACDGIPFEKLVLALLETINYKSQSLPFGQSSCKNEAKI